jgi:poly(hydroxyalkanoate) depolymerase family esterase
MTAKAAATGQTFSGSYSDAAGTRAYTGYVPSTYDAKQATPLLVALHGCTQTADAFRKQTRFDNLAEEKGFIVVYPEQTSKANPMSCWNWFKSEHISRGQGEPSIIAGITDWVKQHYHVDAKRTYVGGFSAGAAMANVMGATYPDVFAAVGVGSGVEYNGGTAALNGSALDAKQAGQAAFKAMGSNAREVPTLVFHGGQDKTVPVNNADKLVQQWQTTDSLVEFGALNSSFPTAASSTKNNPGPGVGSYTVSTFNDGNGHEVLQSWLVPDMKHAWSGGCDCESLSYPSGPDESHAMYDFFVHHPMP